jgi:hypothetical protein
MAHVKVTVFWLFVFDHLGLALAARLDSPAKSDLAYPLAQKCDRGDQGREGRPQIRRDEETLLDAKISVFKGVFRSASLSGRLRLLDSLFRLSRLL